MSRKHYIAAAEVIRAESFGESRRRIAEAFAAMFAADNPRFDRARFMEACGA